MTATEDVLTESQIDAALAELPDWRYRLGGLVTVYKAPTAAAALELIAAVGRLAEEQNHHPDLDWRYSRVFLRYSSHDAGGQSHAAGRRCRNGRRRGSSRGSAPPRSLRRRRAGGPGPGLEETAPGP